MTEKPNFICESELALMSKHASHLQSLRIEPWYPVWTQMAQHHSLVGRDLQVSGWTTHADAQTALTKHNLPFQSSSLYPQVSHTHRPFLPGNTMQDRHINKCQANFTELFLFFLCFKCPFSSCHIEMINKFSSPPCTNLCSFFCLFSSLFAAYYPFHFPLHVAFFHSNSHTPPHCQLDF